AMLAILAPLSGSGGAAHFAQTALGCVAVLLAIGAALNAVAIARLRVWNPSQAVHEAPKETDSETDAVQRARARHIWNNPIIWREICTRAYGRRVFFIKLAYYVLALGVVAYLMRSAGAGELVLGMISPVGFAIVLLSLLSLTLINAQAVTALTSERDGRTLELLLATNITAKEFIYGKLGGTFYNTKELIAIPLLLAAYYAWQGTFSWESFVYIVLGFAVLVVFAAMLGLHSGLSFDSSRSAIGNSLGTLFFLFVGIFVFMMLLVEARSSFFIQFQSFIVFIGVGSIGLYASLTRKNPSAALTLSAGLLPFLTFYAITEFLLQGTLGVCLAIACAYGFATLAMLVPAVSEFDVALGRTTLDKG
ncbi:MAG: ABC transporter permease, partial [Planctomycetes bacterium]|nr:ABC transporter permease [Planctomycetota bacterium]